MSVCSSGQNRSVSSTILIRSISYLHILSSNFRRCVASKLVSKFKNLKFWQILQMIMRWQGVSSERRHSSRSSYCFLVRLSFPLTFLCVGFCAGHWSQLHLLSTGEGPAWLHSSISGGGMMIIKMLQDSGNSVAFAMEIPQSCTKPSHICLLTTINLILVVLNLFLASIKVHNIFYHLSTQRQ